MAFLGPLKSATRYPRPEKSEALHDSPAAPLGPSRRRLEALLAALGVQPPLLAPWHLEGFGVFDSSNI